MVVDDDQDTVAILARHLQREGFVPIEASSGAQCLKLVHENEVDVILLDLMMPGYGRLRGGQGAQEQSRHRRNPYHHDHRARRPGCAGRGDALGVSDFLAKPVFRRQLASRVRAQLEVVETSRNATAAMDRLEAARKNRAQ